MFKNPAAAASAHLVIDRAGAITQMVGFNKRAWHAGKSTWKDLVGMNRFSIGIEIVNAGKLKRSESGDWMSWNSVKIPPDQVIVAQHKNEDAPAGWHIYPEAQITATLNVAVALHAGFEFEDILGHEDIAPTASDPAPPSMASIVSRVFGRHT
jgi:N-acetylmuramoyl-L-alanine amidase